MVGRFSAISRRTMNHRLLLVSQARDEVVRWEEAKKWQSKMERMKSLLKEKERESESLSKQLATLKELYAR